MPPIWHTHAARRAQSAQDMADARRALLDDYRLTFATPHGQRVLADIMRRARVMDTTFHPDPYVAACQEGQRRAALEIVQAINADPDAQLRMARGGDTEDLFIPKEAL
jgi:hypothetical protein